MSKKVILICENSAAVVYHKVNNKVVLLPVRNFTALSSQLLQRAVNSSVTLELLPPAVAIPEGLLSQHHGWGQHLSSRSTSCPHGSPLLHA